MTTVRQYFDAMSRRLVPVLGNADAACSAARIIFDDVAGYSRTFIFVNGDREITPDMQARLDAVVKKVEGGEPVQYAAGKAMFMGNLYAVGPAVLIPRPETAHLVDMIVADADGRSDLRVLDIGTGSGCIAISLARALPFSHVEGIDVSADALALARANAKTLRATVDFVQADILSLTPPSAPRFDIVVSNPPYVCQSEAADMDKRVLDYEPHLALFVPDDDPLLFYRAIARYAMTALVPGGRLYFEINSRFPEETCRLLTTVGFDDAEAIRDYRGLYRYVTARRPDTDA